MGMERWVRGMSTAEAVNGVLSWRTLARDEYWRPGTNERGRFDKQVVNARRSGCATVVNAKQRIVGTIEL